jgi:hypothetical protein
MAGDSMKKVASGDPLRIPARWFNDVTDATVAFKRSRQNTQSGPVPTNRHEGLVLVQNNSGADREQFDILGVDDILFGPDDNLLEFSNNVTYLGVVPTGTHKGKFVICAEPIAKGKFGKAFLFGACPVYLNMVAVTDQFADVKPGDATELQSASSGAVRILWFEGGTGEQWAVVRFSGSGTSIPAPTARYQVYTPLDDTLVPIWTTLRFE